jgi:hypothetical protein
LIDKIEYSESEINNIIQKMNINEYDKSKLYLELDSKESIITEIKYQLNPKLRLRRKRNIKSLLKLGRGRKKKDDPTNTNHNKYSSDNIIKAIKVKLNDSLIYFINKAINCVYENDKEKLIKITEELNTYKNKSNSKYIEAIKKIDYEIFANKTNKKYNLELLSKNKKSIYIKT